MAVGPIGAGVGGMNEDVNVGGAAAVSGRRRSAAVGRGVCVTVGAAADTHALNVAYSATAALSVRNRFPLFMHMCTL